MFRYLRSAFIILLCLVPLHARAGEPLRIAVWNIEGGLNVSGSCWGYVAGFWKYFLPHSTPAIAKIGASLAEMKADIVLLTEVENPSFRNRYQDQVGTISSAASLPFSVFFSTNRFMGMGNQGNAILARFRITEWKGTVLSGGLEQRKLCRAVMSLDGRNVVIMVTHLAQGPGRKRQINHIARLVREETLPVVLAGDFNTDDPVELEPLAREGLIPVKTPATCPSWNPDEAIDRVYIRGDWEIVSGSVPDIHLSDHLPVVVILKLRDPLPQVTADQTEPVSSAPSPAP